MVSIIQNLLTQIPALKSKLVDSQGKPVAARASIPIIPRCMEFDWETAYSPIMPEEEAKMMSEIQARYAKLEAEKEDNPEESDKAKTGGIIVPEGMGKEDDPDDKVTKLKPDMMTDKDNPFNMSLDASGRSNVDLEKAGSDTEPDPKDCNDKLSIGSDKAKAENAKTAGAELDKQTGAEESVDCTVTPEPISMNSKQEDL
jgi:hypothetical protein